METMIHEDEIAQIVRSIWTSILDRVVEVDESCCDGSWEVPGRSLTGCVQLTGDFEGATLLFCTASLARSLASVMFSEDPASLSSEEIRDALGELVNMVAGNIKPLLEGTSRLSLPSVVEGADYEVIVPGSRVVCRVGFRCEGEPLQVTFVERQNG